MALDNDDIKQLIAILQRGLENNEEEADEEETQAPAKAKPKTVKKKSSPKKPKRPNRFESMPEYTMCKEDVEIDRKIKKPPPSIRKPQFEFIKVHCRVCGKKEEVAPSLIETIERYKCNKCSTGAG